MKRRILRCAGLLGILAIALVCGGYTGQAAAGETIVEVGINTEFPYRFEAASVTVPVGATVRWTTSGTAPHTITSEGCMLADYGPCTFDSGAAQETWLRGGTPVTSFEVTFDQPGVYRYLCRLHGQPGGLGQAGTVVVEGAGQAAPAASVRTEPVRVDASVAILSPREGDVIVGDQVTVALSVTGATLRPAVSGTIDPRFGHYHLLLDVTHPLQEEFPPRRPGLFHVPENHFTIPDVAPGRHTLTVVWGFDNHNPPQPPITATVRFTTMAAPETSAAAPSLPAAGAGWHPGDSDPPRDAVVAAGAVVAITLGLFLYGVARKHKRRVAGD